MSNSNLSIISKFILLFSLFLGAEAYASEKQEEISGTVKNIKNKKTLASVNISVIGSNIGTVTNNDGYFSLKATKNELQKGIKIEHLGYQTQVITYQTIEEQKNHLSIYLSPSGKVLKELLVLGGDPKEIVRMAINRIPENYSDKDNLFSGFYRETIQKGNRFINISEGMVDVLKKPYKTRVSNGEKVNLKKGRNLVSAKPTDTLAVKLMGGPYMPVILDAVKNGDHLFTKDEIDYFDFKMESGTLIDDRMHYVISFKPNVSFSYPLHHGVFYIDGENLTINRVEFALDMKDKNKVTRSILQKKPAGLNFKPLEVSGVVSYKTIDGKSYINYINSRIRFKCDWKKRFFSSTYTSNAEMVMVDRDDNPDKHQKFNDTFNSRKVFSDYVEKYWDEDFWKDYNIIEPTESLEKAVDKLKMN